MPQGLQRVGTFQSRDTRHWLINIDCRICNRRRIKCDRSLPSCKKCGIRKLVCTGYDQKLKWDEGVASRGRHAGQPAPIPLKRGSKKGAHGTKVPGGSSSDEQESLPNSPVVETDLVLSRDCSENNTLPGIEGKDTSGTPYGIDLSLSWSQLPKVYQDPNIRRLIHHYDHFVAPTFVWIDTPENRWRNDILPLAQESPSLLFAILALSSANLHSRLPSQQQSSIPMSTEFVRYRDRSLQLLSHQLQDDARSQSGKSVALILATMLVLCNLEMVHPDSTVWRVHLQASRTVIRRWLSTPSLMGLLDATSRYIVTQFSMVNVFASTTCFSDVEEIPRIELVEKEPAIFNDYLESIHDITVEERNRAKSRGTGSVLSPVDLRAFEKRLENARDLTRSLSRELYLSTEQLKRDFDRVVDIYHSAGLIYVCQALAEPKSATMHIPQYLEVLIRDLTLTSASGRFAQDLAWPLFIAGTACRHLGDAQCFIQRWMLESMKSTGFLNCQEALKFLQVFWSTDDVEDDNWIGFARNYAKQGNEFIVL